MDTIVNRHESVTSMMDDTNTFIDFLTCLVTTCEKVKVDMQIVKEDLRRAKREAKELKRKAVEKRGVLAVASVSLGVGAVATIFTGGLALPILLGTGQLITTICANGVNKEFETNIERIISAVDQRSGNAKQRARMVINKRKTYETTINRLKANGIKENIAIFYAVCGMINEMNQGGSNRTFITNGDTLQIMDSSELGIETQGLIERVNSNRDIGVAGTILATVETTTFEKYAPQWLSNSVKSLSGKVPKFGSQFASAAISVLTASVEVISVIRFARNKNKAVRVIDETTELLTEGEKSLDVFIDAITTLRMQALHQQRERQKEIKETALKRIRAENAKYVTIIAAMFLVLAFALILIKF